MVGWSANIETLSSERRSTVEPNKKLAREHGAKPGQIFVKGAITVPDMIAAQEIVDPKDGSQVNGGGLGRPTDTSAATLGADATGPSEPNSEG
jgi:hypothetical protein